MAIETALIPIREGTAQALVQAAKGDVEGALVKLRVKRVKPRVKPYSIL